MIWNNCKKHRNEPEPIVWLRVKMIRISDVGDNFKLWMGGMDKPIPTDFDNPEDWAYFRDYQRYLHLGN